MSGHRIEAEKPVPRDPFLSRLFSSRYPEERVVDEAFDLWRTLEEVAQEYTVLSRDVELQSDIMMRPQMAWEQDGTEYDMQPGPDGKRVQGMREQGYGPVAVTVYYNEVSDPMHGTLSYTPGEDTVTFSAAFNESVPEEAQEAVEEAVERFGFEL